MRVVLALETSAKAASCAIVRDGVPVASAFQMTGLTHSRTLMPMVEAMLRNSELALEEMDVIAVAAGPGSFTGLRIGVAAAKGLAWAVDKPCAGVSTLEAMAAVMTHVDTTLICAMDARRQQIYNAVFRCGGGRMDRIAPDRAIALEELARELKTEERYTVIGDGAPLCCDFLTRQGFSAVPAPPHLLQQSAVGVGICACAMAEQGRLVTAQELTPVYLRLSQAERERLERLGSL